MDFNIKADLVIAFSELVNGVQIVYRRFKVGFMVGRAGGISLDSWQ